MAEILRNQEVGRVSRKLPGRKPMTPAEFVNWIEQHSPSSTPALSSLWRSIAEETLRLQGSSVKRVIKPELQ